MNPNPERGEVWMVDLGMVAKVRPAVILSVAVTEDERNLFGIVPHTAQAWGTRFEAVITVPWLKKGAFALHQFGVSKW